MLTILLRTLIIYLTLVVTMRIMGKRQLGELEVSELVTTLLLSEVASLPITNQDIPLALAWRFCSPDCCCIFRRSRKHCRCVPPS